jgi:hypothetical protein
MFDRQCKELARSFIEDCRPPIVCNDSNVASLAQTIQNSIEMWLGTHGSTDDELQGLVDATQWKNPRKR